MQDMGMTGQQWVVLVAAVTALLGFLFGLIPLLVGISKKQKKLGVWGLVATTASFALAGAIVAIIVVAIFLVLILKRAKAASTDTGEQIQ